jgi:archaeal type IV pilus assembly protein PilA
MGNMKANRKFVEEKEAVSAVIGVILMVAITVAIAATVYVYVSGMIGDSPQSTPSASLNAEPVGTNCTVSIATITSPSTDWGQIEYTLVNLTTATEVITGIGDLPDGEIRGGQIISITGLVSGNRYRFTLASSATGGTIGTVTWTQR